MLVREHTSKRKSGRRQMGDCGEKTRAQDNLQFANFAVWTISEGALKCKKCKCNIHDVADVSGDKNNITITWKCLKCGRKIKGVFSNCKFKWVEF